MTKGRPILAALFVFALAAAGLLLALNALGLQPPANVNAQGSLAALGIMSAVLYAAGLAFGVEQFTRMGTGLLNAEEERYRLLARNMTDVITRHGRNGAVLFVSPAAPPTFRGRARGPTPCPPGNATESAAHSADLMPCHPEERSDEGSASEPSRGADSPLRSE